MNIMNIIKLFPHQEPVYRNIVSCLLNNSFYFDNSPTGSGKSFHVLKLCQEYSLIPITICEASNGDQWRFYYDKYGIAICHQDAVISYQKLRGNHNCFVSRSDSKLKKNIIVTYEPSDFFKSLVRSGRLLLVVDEVQNMKNLHTLNHKVVSSLCNYIVKSGMSRIAFLSATFFDKEDMAKNLMRVSGLLPEGKLYTTDKQTGTIEFDTFNVFYNHCYRIDSKKSEDLLEAHITGKRGKQLDAGLKVFIFQAYVNIIKKRYVFACKFEDQPIMYNGYFNLDSSALSELSKAISELEVATGGFDEKSESAIIRGLPQYINRIEKHKLDIFERVARFYLDSKHKVIIYLNATDSVDTLMDRLAEYNPLRLDGKVAVKTRKVNVIDKFQSNDWKYPLIIGNLIVGGNSINLDDTDGEFKRVMLCSPSFRGMMTHQASGRIQRSTSKSQGRFILVFAKAEARERRILDNLITKGRVMSQITIDNDNIKYPGQYCDFIEFDANDGGDPANGKIVLASERNDDKSNERNDDKSNERSEGEHENKRSEHENKRSEQVEGEPGELNEKEQVEGEPGELNEKEQVEGEPGEGDDFNKLLNSIRSKILEY